MEQNIQEVLKKFTVCEKYTIKTTPKITPNLVPDSEPFKVWGLGVVGVCTTLKQVKDLPLYQLILPPNGPLSRIQKIIQPIKSIVSLIKPLSQIAEHPINY